MGDDATALDRYRERCRDWLCTQDLPRAGEGQDSRDEHDVAVFRDLDHDEELALLRRGMHWQAVKYRAGFGAISWAPEFGGAGLSPNHERVFAEEEARYAVPPSHESLRITVNLAAPTVRELGTDAQRERFVRAFLACEELVCQLFSEPSAGSDLAGVATRAVRDHSAVDGWVVNGSKVWTSGAQFADWGFLIARSHPERAKHAGLTAFLLPMSAPGVQVRPIRQMSGGSSFSEVFLTDVRMSDDCRIGDVGGGWQAALTMLGFERNQSGSKKGVGGSWEQLRELALRSSRRADPAIRDQLVGVYVHERLRELTRARADAARRLGHQPGPEGSIGKLLWSQGLTMIADAAQTLVGPQLTADTGTEGTYSWNEHVLGAPGFRIAGGSDEIQRSIIGERVLGLPREPSAPHPGSSTSKEQP